jgi:hypothetical protein
MKRNEQRRKGKSTQPKRRPTKPNETRIEKRVSSASNMPCTTTLASVRKQIAETEATIGELKGLLHDAMKQLREDGDEVTVLVTDKHGKRIEKQRSNPAMKRIRELSANLRALRRYRTDLLEELAEMTKTRTNEQNVDALDRMLEEDDEAEPKSVDALDKMLSEGDETP